jgi:phosphonate transport system substrate-binding protein
MLAAGCVRAQPPPTELRVGLVPYLSTRAMLGLYQPLRRHLEIELQTPVTLFTAADFRALVENARAGEYALALMPPHLVRIAVADWGHALVARSNSVSEVQLIARRGREPELPAGLRGQRIAALDPLSIGSLALLRWLAEQGLEVGREVQVDYLRSIGSAVIAVQRGDAVALTGATGQLRDLSIDETSDLVRIARLATIPTPAFVAHPSIPLAEVAQWRAALLGFVPPPSADPGLSRQPFVAGSLRDFDSVEDYARVARLMLAQPRPPARAAENRK